MTSSEDRVWEIIGKVGVGMLTTRTLSGEFRSRPVEARPSREEAAIYVMTDVHSAKEHEIERDPNLSFNFIDQQANAYLAIAARGAVNFDRATIREYWKSTDGVWWKGPDDQTYVSFARS